MPFGLAPPWKYPPDVAVYLKDQPQVDVIGRYRILSAQKYAGPAGLPLRSSPGTLEGELIGAGCGSSRVFGGGTLKASSYHLNNTAHVVFLVCGADKASTLKDVLQGPHQTDLLPA